MRDWYSIWLVMALVVGLQGCASLGDAAHKLRSEDRPLPVRSAAYVGDTAGFVAAVPVSVALFPILVPVVHLVDVGDPYALLFLPSIKFGELLSVILGAPIDLVLSLFVGGPEEEPAPEEGETEPQPKAPEETAPSGPGPPEEAEPPPSDESPDPAPER